MEHIDDLYAVCTYIPFHNEENNYTIAKFKEIGGSGLNFTVKGQYLSKVGNKYYVSGKNSNDAKYPNTFFSLNVKPDIDLSKASKSSLVTYLSTVTSSTIAKRLVNDIPDIIKVIETGDIDKLSEVKGVGAVVAQRIMDLHDQQIDYGEALIELAKFNLTPQAIKQIVKLFKGSELAIKKMNENPYCLTEFKGFGFKRCDAMFLIANQSDPNAVRDKRRVHAYVDYLFEEEGQAGNTWLSPREFMDKVVEFIPEADIVDAIEYVNESHKYVTVDSHGAKRITSAKYMEMELEVAEILRSMSSRKTDVKLEKVDDILLHAETNQGFPFDDDQRTAILDILNNDVYLLQGGSGVGKTTTINGVSRVLRDNGYSIAQSALSGRAANNLAQITGFEGKTIHSLIKFGSREPHGKDNHLPFDVVIVDEISMVNIEIFLALLRSLKPSAKLIMLGDSGQLDSIGVGVMTGMMYSGSIHGTTLTKIHRQAAKSAIITHSIAIRSGDKPSELTIKSNTDKSYGENKDFEYIFTKNSEENNVYKYVMIRFKDSIDKYGVDNTQILCATRKAGNASVANLNYYAQIAANPKSPEKREIHVQDGESDYVLREGDKVINMVNNYNTSDINGVETPIFNGNTGTVLSIDEDTHTMIVRFDGIGDIVIATNTMKDSIQLGYAMTTHKSQGSTIKSVIVALPFHFMLNSRELLYTAITRASDRVTLVTSPKSFQGALRKTSKRTQQTNLSLYLQDYDTWAGKHAQKTNKK